MLISREDNELLYYLIFKDEKPSDTHPGAGDRPAAAEKA